MKERSYKTKQRLLIVKNDSIGDYIIFRNFIEAIRRSRKFKNYEIYLLTTQKLQPIANDLDAALLKEVLVMPKDLISVAGPLAFYKLIRSYAFDSIFHPTYSPDNRTQYMMKYLRAPHKIGFNGDLSNQTQEDKTYFERYYTQLISIRDQHSHEFEKNVDFFAAVLEEDPGVVKPTLEMSHSGSEKRILICPGAQHAFRIWSLEKFGTLINQLRKEFSDYTFTVVTGPGEDKLFEGIKQHVQGVIDQYKIGRISDLARRISGASLVVCNDSSAAHISVACNTENVCISNGNHFGRFIPYPKEMHVKQQVLLPETLKQELKAGNEKKYYSGSTLDINEISVEDVFNACLSYLKSQQQ